MATFAATLAVLALAATPAAGAHYYGATYGNSDGFGYETQNVPYAFTDISATGTEVQFDGEGRNSVLGPFALPPGFEFLFYGEEKTQFWISSNGFITFTDQPGLHSCCGVNYHLPNSGNFPLGDFIAGMGGFMSYDDADDGCGTVHIGEVPAPDRYVIQFTDVCYQGKGLKATFQIQLHESTNHVEVHYLQYTTCNSSCGRTYTAGIENRTQTDGLTFMALGSPFFFDKEIAVRYKYPNQAPVAADDGDSDGDGIVEDALFVIDRETASVDLDVLANDIDLDDDPLTVTAVTTPSDNGYGTIAVAADGNVTYTLDTADPDVSVLTYGQSLTDTFTYTVSDGNGGTADGKVTIKVVGIDKVPDLVRNDPLSVIEAHPGLAPTAITTARLDASDEDDPADSIMFRLLSLPAGTLWLEGVPAAVGDTFARTALDPSNPRLTYLAPKTDPVPGPYQDSFTFRVYDPTNETDLAYQGGAAQTFRIQIADWDDPPVPSFEITPGPFYTTVGISFNDTTVPGDEPISAWAWDFGDGGTGTGRHPGHAYAAPGTYVVRLTVTEGVQMRSVERTIDVIRYVPPLVSFHSDTAFARVGEPVWFTDTSVPGSAPTLSRTWDFHDARPLAGADDSEHVVHHFTQPGTYIVTLTLRDALGLVHHERHTIVVEGSGPPTRPDDAGPAGRPGGLVADAGVDQVVVQGTVVALQGSASGAVGDVTFTWEQVEGPLMQLRGADTATPRFAVPWMAVRGADIVFQLTVHDARGSADDKVRFVVRAQGDPSHPPVPPPSADFTVEHRTGGLVVLTASGQATRYEWDLGDGTVATGRSVEHRYADAGRYPVRLVVLDEFARQDEQTGVVVLQGPEPTMQAAASTKPPLWPWFAGGIVLVAAATAGFVHLLGRRRRR